MFYTYILKQDDSRHFYVGSTENLKRRFQEHKQGKTRSTRGRDWNLWCYFAFRTKDLAETFEKYLKTGSGRSFSKRHLSFEISSTELHSAEATAQAS